MLTVTPGASARLAEIITQQGLADDIAVRLVQEDQGIEMQADTKNSDDTAFEHNGRTVLLVDKQLAELLAEDTLDVEGEMLTLLRGEDDDDEGEDENE